MRNSTRHAHRSLQVPIERLVHLLVPEAECLRAVKCVGRGGCATRVMRNRIQFDL